MHFFYVSLAYSLCIALFELLFFNDVLPSILTLAGSSLVKEGYSEIVSTCYFGVNVGFRSIKIEPLIVIRDFKSMTVYPVCNILLCFSREAFHL